MKLRFLQSVAVLTWGIQADLIWFALPMGIIWEAQFFINRRWSLTQQDFYRIADLTLVSLALMLIFLFLNRTEYHFVTTLFQWFPILVFPLVIVYSYSLTERMQLDVLFPSLRRQKQPVTQSWDMNYLLFATCLVAAGTNLSGAGFYFPLVCLLLCLSLIPLRSSRYPLKLWILLATFTILTAFITQQGIRGAHVELKQRAQVWIANWIQRRSNLLKTQTAIGAVGQLKLSSEILFRVRVPANPLSTALLQEASYDLLVENTWSVLSSFEQVDHAGDFHWKFDTEPVHRTASTPSRMDIYLEFEYEQSIVPLPPGVTEIIDLPAIDIRQNNYGAIQAIGLFPSPAYQVKFVPGLYRNGEPSEIDTSIPAQYKNLLRKVTDINRLDPDNPIESIHNYFRDFRYSLYQDTSISDEPIAHFLLESKKGHCEYYATTTVLLLRELGIPARYVIGFALQEYNSMLDMYVVRQRHAHAWAIAYIDGTWQVVDTTPAIWAEKEAGEATLLQPLFDAVKNTNFMFQVWRREQKLEDYETHLYVIGLILSLILAWRIFTSEQVIINKETQDDPVENKPSYGTESPFFSLEQFLHRIGYSRGPGELLAPWLTRIGYGHLIRILPAHNQWRFDPHGISNQQKDQLTREVEECISQLKETIEQTGKQA